MNTFNFLQTKKHIKHIHLAELMEYMQVGELAGMKQATTKMGLASTKDVLTEEASKFFATGPLNGLECIGEGGLGVVYRNGDRADKIIPIGLRYPAGDGFKDYRVVEENGRYKIQIGGMALPLHEREVAVLTRCYNEVRFLKQFAICADPRTKHLPSYFDSGFVTLNNYVCFYIRQDFIPGRTLESLLDASADRGVKEGAAVLLQVANVLNYCTEKGIVHADVKPPNIIVSASLDTKLLDFGIARRENENGDGSFTPGYAAPEQMRGESLTPNADTFTLGLNTARVLTGQDAFPYEVPIDYGSMDRDRIIKNIKDAGYTDVNLILALTLALEQNPVAREREPLRQELRALTER